MITDWFLPPFPTEKQALYCQPLWLPTSPPRLEFTIIAPRSAQLGFWLPTTCPARVCACVPHSHPGCPHHQQETTFSHFWVSEYHSGSFLLWINDLGSQTSAFFKMPHVVPTGGLAEKWEGNAVTQALAPAGAEPSPQPLSFTFRPSPFMSFLLTFFYLSPGPAPNWKTETQTGVGKPVLPRESSTGARGHGREKKQAQEAAGFPSTLRSCSDLQTLVKILIARQLPTILSIGRFSFHSEKENGLFRLQKSFLGSSQTTLSMGWMFLNFFSSHYTSPCCLCYFSGRGTGPKYFEANKCFKNQPLPQGILGRLSSKVP